jgi:hypothetical protein
MPVQGFAQLSAFAAEKSELPIKTLLLLLILFS